jgi:hypothetical protein
MSKKKVPNGPGKRTRKSAHGAVPRPQASAGGKDAGGRKAKGASAQPPSHSAPPAAEGRDARLPLVGTVLVKRDRQGARCECTVEADGFRYRNTLHRSLTAAASAAASDLGIKGRVNGFVFWGLVKGSAKVKDPAALLRRIAGRYEERVATFLKMDRSPEIRKDVRRELEAHAAHLTALLAKAAA